MLQPDSRLLALRDALPGRVLRGTRGARYHLRERVGEGGQGWVFTASWDEPEGFLVIVKVLRPDATARESLVRFEREAQVLQMLGQTAQPNPHIVRFFDHASTRLPSPTGGEPVELRYTVLEYVRGPTLEQVLAQSKGVGLPLERTRRIGRQVTRALEDVHAHRVVHRDLKPSNVLLANEGGTEVAKVTDFGLVKLVEMGLGKTVTLAGASLGYAPPEQFEQGNRRVGTQTDVFSLAAILYEMLTGIRAFPHNDTENPLLIVTRLLNGPRPLLTAARGSLPPELASRRDLVERLEPILVRATAAEPSDRHASVAELWAAVEPLLRASSESRPVSSSRGAESRPSQTPALAETVETHARQSPSVEIDPRLASPAAWTWRVLVPPLRAGAARSAAFEAGGESAIASGTVGLLRLAGPSWAKMTEPPNLDPARVRGLAWLRAGEPVLYGTGGLVGRLVGPAPAFEPWEVPDKEATFLGAHIDPQGILTVVGERPARRAAPGQAPTAGVIAQFTRGRLSLLCDAPSALRLRSVTRLRSGVVVACGDWGTLVRLELGVPEPVGAVCSGHLHAIAALADGGAVTVGAGGHALLLSPRLQAQLEAVQTTRDLCALAVDSAQVAWAGSAQARVLRRTAGSWVRMSGELGLTSSVVALWVTPRAIRAICDDGALVEGVVA